MRVCQVWKMSAAAVVSGMLAAGAMAADSDRETQLEREVQVLKDQVAQLQAKDNEDWLTERRAEEIKALVHEVLADAETRASFAEGGMVAGWNKNFFLASEDGNFMLKLKGQIATRYIFNNRDDEESDSLSDNDEGGFQIRRTKLNFSGHIFDPKLQYEVVLAAERDTEIIVAEQIVTSYEFADGWKIKGGRYKQPFLREELTSSSKQTAVERSSMNEFFTLNKGEGVGLVFTGTSLRGEAMLHDGAQSGEPGGLSNDYASDATDYAVTGRVDWLVAGDWKQFDDFASWSNDKFGVMLGAAVNYEVGETGDRQSTITWDDWISYTVDGSVEYGGANLFAAFAGRNLNGASSSSDVDFDDYGVVVQAGYMVIPDTFEPFARYEWIRVDGSGDIGAEDINILTFGANYYFKRHDVKFTMDVVWGLDPLIGLSRSTITASGTSSGLGLATDKPDQDGQVAIRAQFQLLF